MKKVNHIFVLVPIVAVLLTSCMKGQDQRVQSSNSTYVMLQVEANNIFGNKLENEYGYCSYSSHSIAYEINLENLNILQFEEYKNTILPKAGWHFFMKKGAAFIFCNGAQQLEMIPPKILMDSITMSGDIGKQLEDYWNIIFYHPRNSSINVCDKNHH